MASGEGVQPHDLPTLHDRSNRAVVESGASRDPEQDVGTPGYMSPEQAQGAEADHRSDIALGAVTYRALAGRPAFSGRDTPQILFDIIYRMPARPSSVIPSLPADVELVIAIAMAKRPDDRFASVLEFSAALSLAGKGTLDPDTRARAQSLVARNPWGRSVLDARKEKEQLKS